MQKALLILSICAFVALSFTKSTAPKPAPALAYSGGTIHHGGGVQSCFSCHQGGNYRGCGLAVRNYLAPGKWQPGGGNVIAIQALAARATSAGTITGGDPRLESWAAQVFFSDSNGNPIPVRIISTDSNNGGAFADTVATGYTFLEMTGDSLAWINNPVYFPNVQVAKWSGVAFSFYVSDTAYLGDILMRTDVVLADGDGTMAGDVPITSINRLRACVPLQASTPWQYDFGMEPDPPVRRTPRGFAFSRSAGAWKVASITGRMVGSGRGPGEVCATSGVYVVMLEGETAKKYVVR